MSLSLSLSCLTLTITIRLKVQTVAAKYASFPIKMVDMQHSVAAPHLPPPPSPNLQSSCSNPLGEQLLGQGWGRVGGVASRPLLFQAAPPTPQNNRSCRALSGFIHKSHRHHKNTQSSTKTNLMTLAGLEPAIFGSEDQRLIH